MRLHRLEVQAFGPFAAPQQVDFDALAEGGLFLLHGPTGAGKTSVLDAVCFALYGRVPGVRAGASRLRSDHADPELPPQVVCEFSVGARRFEVTRSPAWERRKRRGEGTTEEKARVLLREAVPTAGPDGGVDGGLDAGADAGDGWRVLTQRSDEAAHLLDAVLGLSLDQFTKLVLLAQGEFAAFLRADAESRRAMLERLFDTERFTQLQTWLHDRQLRLRRRAEDCDRRTRDLVARARQAAAVLPMVEPPPPPAPTGPVQGDLLFGFDEAAAEPAAEPDDETAPGELVALLHRRAVHAWETTTARRAVTRKKATRARSAHQKVERLAGLQREHAALTARVAALHEATEVHEATLRRLREADRAVPLAALAPPLHTAREQAGRAHAALAALEPAGSPEAAATDADLRAAGTGLTEQLARLEDLRVAEQRLARLAAEAAAARPLVAAAEQAHRTLLQDQAAIAGQLAAVREQQAAAGAVAGSVDALREARQQAADVVAAVQRRDLLAPAVAQATATRDVARTAALDARDRVLDLRERRLAGMAAELAERLADGDPCPVCGAAEHPSPAGAGPEPVTPADERAAAERLRRAEQQLADAEQEVAGLTEQLAAANAVAGTLTARTAEARHRRAADALDQVDQAARLQDRLAAVIREAETELALLAGHVAAAVERLDGARAAAADLVARRDELSARVADGLGVTGPAASSGAPSSGAGQGAVAARIAGLQTELARCEARLSARQAVATARDRLADAERAAAAAAAEAGFDTLEQALAALLPAARHAELQQAVRDHQDELAAATARLQHPEVAEAAAAAAADPAQTSAALELAVADEDRAAREAALCDQAVEALAGLTDTLAEHLRLAGPVLAEFRLVNELSRCADGTGGDNTLRMSLSAYVLAARLEQVAEAASARLLQMSGGRYALTHTDAVQRGRGRSGLGLLVVDGWTGQARDTASLSGGETFYTSLALALGLADVVCAEAGGTAIETLFVDEGFGTLDDQTLEDVMDVLDGLRAGGRAVGLVSHVADLRDRIPAQLEVLRGRAGSTLRQSVA